MRYTIARTALAVLALGACGGAGPTEPTADAGPTAPALGTYRATFTYRLEIGRPGTYSADLTLTSASREEIAGTASGAYVQPGPFALGFWNYSAYLVYVRMTFTPTAQIRLAFWPTPTCSGQVRYNDGRLYEMESCTLARVP